MSTETQQGKMPPHHKIILLYIMFFGSLTMFLVPFIYTAVIALILCTITMVGIYSEKADAEEDSVMQAHMIFLIHTFWYSALFLLYAAMAALMYLLIFANYADVPECTMALCEQIARSVIAWDLEFMKIFSECSGNFIKNNYLHLWRSRMIAFSPVLLYLVYRFIKGWLYAVKYQAVTN